MIFSLQSSNLRLFRAFIALFLLNLIYELRTLILTYNYIFMLNDSNYAPILYYCPLSSQPMLFIAIEFTPDDY